MRYAALLRAINVGGKNKISMADLKRWVEALGHEHVLTYIQSGNVLLSASVARDKVASDLQAAILAESGLRVPVVLRTEPELTACIEHNPYDTTAYVMFLSDTPSAAAVASLNPDRSPPDRFTVWKDCLYLHCPNGVGRSKLTVDYFDRTLKVTGTARNWKTVVTLRDMLLQGAPSRTQKK